MSLHSCGLPLTKQVLRKGFEKARAAAAAKALKTGNAEISDGIKAMWFYDLTAKAADDTAELRGEQAAADLLAHESVQTTKDHYLPRGMIVSPSK